MRWYRSPIPRHTAFGQMDNTSASLASVRFDRRPAFERGGLIIVAWSSAILLAVGTLMESVAGLDTGQRSAVAALLILFATTMAVAEGCDTALYGNLCGTQTRPPTNPRPSSPSLPPVQGISGDQWARQDRPGTLGAITFQGGKQCIGLLRRSNCN
jgi:hypothetical protein